MNFYKISDKIVFNTLKNIEVGYLEIINHNGELLKFGNPDQRLKAEAQDALGNWVFSKGFTVGPILRYEKDFNLEFNLNSYRDNVADAI